MLQYIGTFKSKKKIAQVFFLQTETDHILLTLCLALAYVLSLALALPKRCHLVFFFF